MKKLWIALALIVVIRLVSLVYLEMKLLDEPIILAQDVSLKNDSLYVSYITNNAEPHEISHVEIGDTYLYPNQDDDFFGFVTGSTESNEYVRGRIYSVHAVTLPLNLESRELNFPKATTAIIHFKNGMQWEEPLKVGRSWVNQEILHESFSKVSTDHTVEETYITQQDVILTNLDVGELEDVSLSINGEKVVLPLTTGITIPKDKLIKLNYSTQVGLYPFDEYEIIFNLLDEKNVPIEIAMGKYKNNSPSSNWIHEMVKERGTK